MKDFKKLTHKELIKLTEEKLGNYVKLELANQGIPFLDHPKEPEYEAIKEPDLILYTAAFLNVYCTDEKVINQINNILFNNKTKLKKIGYEYGKNKIEYTKKDLKENSWDEEISNKSISKTVYSDELYYEIKTIVDRNAKKLLNHEDNLAKWEEIQHQINDVKAEIYDKYNEAIQKEYENNQTINKFKEYLKLSNNDKTIALNFLKKVYTIDKETEKMLLNDLFGCYCLGVLGAFYNFIILGTIAAILIYCVNNYWK
jgi:hypothetical protein